MRGYWAGVLLAMGAGLSGCVVDDGVPEPGPMPDDPAASTDCAMDVALDTSQGSVPVELGSVSADASGFLVCLTLDGRDVVGAGHFAAVTDREAGAQSSFELTLEDADGAVLRDGWDVTVGQSSPETFANLEYDVAAGQITPVQLRVRGRAGTASSHLDLYFFEPYE